MDWLVDGRSILFEATRALASNVSDLPECVEIDGEDLRAYEWLARRATLRSLLRRAGRGMRLSEHLDGNGALAFRHAWFMGLAGIVAKRRDKPYRSGRSPDWVKIKNAPTRILEW
jgi:bifunctional non-homologous end joining protein LigD